MVDRYPALTFHVRAQQTEFVRGLNLKFFPVRDEAGNLLVTGLSLRDLTPDQVRVRLKDELIHAVSHELRDPLTIIWGFAQLLRTRDLPEDKRAQAVETIYLEAEHLSGMVHDLLDWRQLESGRYSLNCGPVDLAETLRKTAQRIGNHWPEHSIQTDLPPDLPQVRADAKGLEHILRNLLTNACKYSPLGGPVIVAANVFEAEARVTVTDQGLGLPPETIPHLFDGYYRVQSDDRRAISGVGLGLAIVRRLIVDQGGRVWAESAGPGAGSTFGFTLPLFTREEGVQICPAPI
jgi:signal transduction histidine kinase